jgi:uncharacterized protein YciI
VEALVRQGKAELKMKKLFAVIRSRGSAWHASRSLEEQQEWGTHAAFMNGLAKEGFVVLGGPLEGSDDVLLIVRAETEQEIIERFAVDPWSRMDLLRIHRVAPWHLRLGSLS